MILLTSATDTNKGERPWSTLNVSGQPVEAPGGWTNTGSTPSLT